MTFRKPSKNFLRKNLTSRDYHRYMILKLISLGHYPAKIGRVLGYSRQHIHYYIKKFLEQKLITRQPGRWAFYTLTQLGKKYFERLESRLPLGRVVRLHNVVVLYPVLKDPQVVIDWGKVVRLRNWGQLVGSELGLTVRKNPRSVEVFCDVLEGDNPYELLFLAKEQADRLACHLESKFQMKLGRGRLSRKPHFGIYDPALREVGKVFELSDDVGKVDESEGYGEADIYDPNLAKNYLLTVTTVLPQTLKKIGKQLGELEKSQVILTETLPNRLEKIVSTFEKSMQEHMGIIKDFRKESKQRSKEFKKLVRLVKPRKPQRKRRRKNLGIVRRKADQKVVEIRRKVEETLAKLQETEACGLP